MEVRLLASMAVSVSSGTDRRMCKMVARTVGEGDVGGAAGSGRVRFLACGDAAVVLPVLGLLTVQRL